MTCARYGVSVGPRRRLRGLGGVRGGTALLATPQTLYRFEVHSSGSHAADEWWGGSGSRRGKRSDTLANQCSKKLNNKDLGRLPLPLPRSWWRYCHLLDLVNLRNIKTSTVMTSSFQERQ